MYAPVLQACPSSGCPIVGGWEYRKLAAAYDAPVPPSRVPLRVPTTYLRYNGASIPPWARPWLGDPFDHQHRSAALVHDYLYDLGDHRPPAYRKRAQVDGLFWAMLVLGGVGSTKAGAMWLAVRAAGRRFFSANDDLTGLGPSGRAPLDQAKEWWAHVEEEVRQPKEVDIPVLPKKYFVLSTDVRLRNTEGEPAFKSWSLMDDDELLIATPDLEEARAELARVLEDRAAGTL